MAKDRFEDFFIRALEHEGRVCEDVPGDNGGPTKWGVTIGRLATIKGVKEPRRGTAAFNIMKSDLYALEEAEIRNIYRKDYWDAVRADELPPGLDYAVVDFGLNSGPSRGIKALQKVCGNAQTGRMDDETIREANAFDAKEIIDLYCDERERFLRAIVANNPKQGKFIKGWLNRVADVRRVATNQAHRVAVAPEAPPPMPKAVVLEPPAPSTTKEAVKSPSTWLILGAIGGAIESSFNFIAGMLPDAQRAVTEVVDPLTSLGGMLKINMAGITASLAFGALVVVLIRNTNKSIALAKAKRAAGVQS